MFRKPLSQLTFDDVVEFCRKQHAEGIFLEYKQKFSSNNRGKQVAKEISAFANTQGGYLIFGVVEEEETTRRPAAAQAGMDLGTNPREAVLEACHQNVFPPIQPEISDYLPNPQDARKGFLVILVHPGETIYAVEDQQGFYVRVQDLSTPIRANLEQLRWLQQRHDKSTSLKEELIQTNETRLRRLPGISGPPLALVTICPSFPIRELIDVVSLRAVAQGFRGSTSVASVYDRWYGRPPHVLSDAVYASSGNQGGMLAHSYGLVSLSESITDLAQNADTHHVDDALLQLLDTTRDEVGQMRVISLWRIYHALRDTLVFAHSLYRHLDFHGMYEIRLTLDGIRQWPLIALNDKVVGGNPVDDVQTFSLTTAVDESVEHINAILMDAMKWSLRTCGYTASQDSDIDGLMTTWGRPPRAPT